jgi:hypothetical protein
MKIALEYSKQLIPRTMTSQRFKFNFVKWHSFRRSLMKIDLLEVM